MTRTGKYRWQTDDMDLIELSRTIQADKNCAIAVETRRRQLLSTIAAAPQLAPAARPIGQPQRPASTGVLSR